MHGIQTRNSPECQVDDNVDTPAGHGLANEVKAKLFGCSQSGRTPLYIAARGSFTAIVDMIIKTARLDYPTPVGVLNSILPGQKIAETFRTPRQCILTAVSDAIMSGG